MTSPLYTAPWVDASGLHVPNFAAIQAQLVAAYQAIYTQGAYLANDSADYQEISITARAISDAMEALVLDYNNRAPSTAIGSALDGLIKLCGIARKVPSASTCQVTLTGTAGTVISGGIVGDVNGNSWLLPTPLLLPLGGSLTVTAICQTIGAITALAGNLSIILTPTAGWTGVTNSAAAVTGQASETDSQLRARQALSAALPSSTRLAGTIAEIAAVEGVTRWNVVENNTNDSPDANGLISHSIWAIVEGGTDLDVATAIFNNKGPGCGLNGARTVAITDPYTGLSTNISFSWPTYVPIYVSASVYLFPSGTTAMLAQIGTAILNYLNSLSIGEIVTLSGLYAAAMSVMPNIYAPAFSITSLTLGKTSSPTGVTDIVLTFKEVSEGIADGSHVLVVQQTGTP